MKKTLLTFFILSAFLTVHAQLSVNSSVNATQLVNGFIGAGLSVSNITLNCPSGAYGTFANGNTTTLNLSSGSVFTTGSAAGTIGPNNSASYGVSNGTTTSDPNLTTIEPQATRDPCILTFNVSPSCSTLTIRFVFGSEEYPEWVSAGYNDAFGFFITGPNPSGPAYSGYNTARLPNGTPVSIDNVNASANAAFYQNNTGGATIQYDGLTTVITSNLAVVPCSTYFFKIAIADAGDYIYDSGVFIDLLTCSSAITSTTSSTPSCGCTGSASVTAAGGQPPYTYMWNTTPAQSGQTATGLCPGNYVVTVYDQNGCVSNSNSSTVTVGSLASGTASIASVNASCSGGNNGSATASITGGTAPYTYVWNTTPAQSTQTATGLSSGTYNVTVYDGNGCVAFSSVTISEPTVLSGSVSSSSNVSCFNGSNGSATATGSGGTPGYSYSWSSGGGSAATATNLSPGNYVVTVTDANGCSGTASVTISQPAALTSSVSASASAGCTVANGTATANASGGTPGYTYLWNPSGQTSQTATGLSSGTYTVVVTDNNGCTSGATVTISGTSAPTVTNITSTSSACGASNGTAAVAVAGGSPPYTYLWNPSAAATATATGLSAGNYAVTVTDANGCTATASVSVTSSNGPSVTASVIKNVSCNGGNNGSAAASPSGGTPGYIYAWSPSGGNAQTAINLAVGNYTCLVTDANGCTSVTTVSITQPPVITLAVSGTDSICQGGNSVLTTSASGGTPGYTYVWNPGASSGNSITVSPSTSTSYSVTITDASGCVSSLQTFSVSVLPAPNALFDTTVAGGILNAAFTFNDQSSGANSWLWIFGDNSANSTLQNPVHVFPGAGTYTVTQIVFNQFGCPDTFKLVLYVYEGIVIPNVFTPDGNGINDVWYIPNSGMKEFHVMIFDRWGLKLFETTADEIRWDGRSSAGKLLSDGTYYYVLTAVLKSFYGNKDYSTKGHISLLTQTRK